MIFFAVILIHKCIERDTYELSGLTNSIFHGLFHNILQHPIFKVLPKRPPGSPGTFFFLNVQFPSFLRTCGCTRPDSGLFVDNGCRQKCQEEKELLGPQRGQRIRTVENWSHWRCRIFYMAEYYGELEVFGILP